MKTLIITTALLASLIPGCAQEPVEQIKIASWNILHSNDNSMPWEDRKHGVVEQIQSENVDILCLQEVTRTQYRFLQKELNEYQSISIDYTNSKELGNPIFYKEQLLKYEIIWLSETPKVARSISWGDKYPRHYMKATFENLTIINTHLSRKPLESNKKGLEILSLEDAVVVGDLNAQPDIVQAYFGDIYNKIPTYKKEKIDYIFPEKNTYVIKSDLSDHNMIFMMLDHTPPNTRSSP